MYCIVAYSINNKIKNIHRIKKHKNIKCVINNYGLVYTVFLLTG